MKKIAMIDYGIGNLLSVTRAFNHFEAEVILVETPEQILEADRLVLPGVGAFEDGMKGLSNAGLVESIKEYISKERPFLGICLGMQLMLTKSYEFGTHQGLDLIAGEVTPIPTKDSDGQPHKIPHIGWNELFASNAEINIENSILRNLDKTPSVYFVHSFMAQPTDKMHRLADCSYGGHSICAAIQKDNIYGFQFHPEKSGEVGLKIIHNFLQL